MGAISRAGLELTQRPVRISIDDDVYAWVQEQAALLRAGKFSDIDALALAEEIDDLGREQFDKLESALRVLLVHMLKWDHQPKRRSRSWVLTILEQRQRITRVLDRNPSLKARLSEAINSAYDDARLAASRETRQVLKGFPVTCPYSFDTIQTRSFVIDDIEI